MTGHWLDLWDHPEHETCKVLKGIKELSEWQQEQQSGSPGLPATTDTTANVDAEGSKGLTPAKVIQEFNVGARDLGPLHLYVLSGCT